MSASISFHPRDVSAFPPLVAQCPRDSIAAFRIKKAPWCALAGAGLAVLVYLLPAWTNALQFDRAAMGAGELWRLLTGHFTHFSNAHLRWDAVVFVGLGGLVELRHRRDFFLCVLGSALVISMGVAMFQPHFMTYRGLSGVDSALFGYLCADVAVLAHCERNRWYTAGATIAALSFIAKALFEFLTGTSLFVQAPEAFVTAPLAHLLGALFGASLVLKRWRSSRQDRVVG
jgi:rhomboid family GlyGly-CTERM serine protease